MLLTHPPQPIAPCSLSREAASLSTAHSGVPEQKLYLAYSQPEPTQTDLEEYLAYLAAQEDRWEDAEGAE